MQEPITEGLGLRKKKKIIKRMETSWRGARENY